MKTAFPIAYAGVFAEISLDKWGGDARYGAADTTRLDVIEEIPPVEPEIVCNYDVKTGGARLESEQLRRQAERLRARYRNAIIFILQIKPFNDQNR